MTQGWYVIHTYSGFENKVKASIEQKTAALGLADKISKILIPTEEVVELRKGKKKVSTRKFFPGYLLIKMEMSDDLWYLVKNTPKVTGFVGSGTKPVPISDAEAEGIIKQMETGGDRPRHRILYVQGETVRIIDGPFTNFSGVVEEVKAEKGRLKVMVSIFGRSTPVDLDFLQVERL